MIVFSVESGVPKFWDSIRAGCGIGCMGALQSRECGVGQGQIRRLGVEDLLAIQEDTRGDVRGNESHVVRALSIEDAVPAGVAELGEGAAEGPRILRRVPDRSPDEDLPLAVIPEREAVAIPPGGGVASGFW